MRISIFFLAAYLSFWFYFLGLLIIQCRCGLSNSFLDCPNNRVQVDKVIRFFFIIFLFFLDAILIFFSRSFPFSFQMFLTMSAEMRFIPDFRKAHKSVLRGQLEKKRPRCSNRALFTEMSRDRNHIITELPRFRALQEENKGHVGQNTEHGERPGQPDSATPPRPPGCRRMCSSCCMHPTGCLSSREHP